MNLSFTATDFFALKPVILLCLFGLGILLTDLLIRDSRYRWLNGVTALIGQGFVAFAVWQHHVHLSEAGRDLVALSGALVVDQFSVFFNCIFIAATILAILISVRYLEHEGEHRGAVPDRTKAARRSERNASAHTLLSCRC